MNSVGIFGSVKKDLLLIYALPFALLLAMSLYPGLWNNALLGFVVLFLIDTGHTYTTALRTYLNKLEFSRDRTYVIAPFFVFLTVYSWTYLGLPFFWNALIYLTFYHHIRQYYGIMRWYARIEKIEVKREGTHLYALLIVPFILFHFRGDELSYAALFDKSEIAFFPPPPFYRELTLLFTGYIVLVLIELFRKFLRRKIGIGFLLSVAFPALLHYIVFLYFTHSYQILIPILCIHGLTYILITHLSVERLAQGKHSPGKIWSMILGLVIGLSGIEYFTIETFDIFSGRKLEGQVVPCAMIALSLLPNILHYYYDGFLWKKKHPDFQKIMQSTDGALHG